MFTSLMPVPKQRFYSNAGLPLVGGKIYTYAAGTVVPKDTYTDSAGTIPQANPIILNARGEPNVAIRWSGSYYIEVKDALGNLVYTVDDYQTPVTFGSLLDPTGAGLVGFSYALAYGAGTVGKWLKDLAGTAGGGLIGFIQSGINSVLRNMQSKVRDYPITPQDYGALGDNTADDTVAIQRMLATGRVWYIPYTAAGYKITQSIHIISDGVCDGTLMPTAAIGAAVFDYDKFAVIIDSGGYGQKRFIRGIKVQGSVALRAALVKGIRNDCENSILENCYCPQLDYGIVVRAYSITLLKCNAAQCNTNLSAYAPAANREINALTIDGGNYDSAVTYGANIGDTRWSDAIPAASSHGVCINIINGVNFDGAEVKVDSVSVVNINGIYHETSPTTGILVRLGGAYDGSVRNVKINNNFLKTANFAVYCATAVEKLTVQDNFLSGIQVSEVRLSSDIYGINYRPGVQAGCFAKGQPVGINFRSVAIASVTFTNFTLEQDGLVSGCQDTMDVPAKWYPSGQKRNGLNRTINVSSTATAFYNAPALAKAGTVLGTLFTFTTPADCYAFNGGDRLLTAPVGATYVRSVDYLAGTMIIDGGVTANGAATASQVVATTAVAA